MGESKPARIAAAATIVIALALSPLVGHVRAAEPNPDPSAPSGSLVAGGELSGTAEIDFLFDPTGTYTATVTVDGQTLVSEAENQGSAHLYLDTTKLLDGSHAVVVDIGDASETSTVWSGTIETRNAPQGGLPSISGSTTVGATLTANAGFWQPQPSSITYQWKRCGLDASACAPIGADASSYTLTAADSNAEVEVEVTADDADGSTTATSSPTAVIAATLGASTAAGSANGDNACSGARLAAELGDSETETVPLDSEATLHGVLGCNGTPISGATLDLALAPASGTTPTTYAQIQTAADGSFEYTLPPGPSRDITLTYSASSGGAPSAVATLALRVKSRIALTITPRSTTNGHTITFTGRVFGGYISTRGLPLEVEYREGRSWMIYTEILARPNSGSFRWRYTFERTTESINYTFRVAIPTTGVAGYPYQPVASAPRSVHVDP